MYMKCAEIILRDLNEDANECTDFDTEFTDFIAPCVLIRHLKLHSRLIHPM